MIGIKKYHWYLFDLDNTILDFSKASALAFEETLKHFNVKPNDNNSVIYHNINKSYWQRYEKGLINASTLRKGRFKDFLQEINHSEDALKMSETYLDYLLKHSQEIAGSINTLNSLSKKSNLALITNGLSDIQHKRIKKHQLKDFFKHIFISEEMGVSKPAFDFFNIVHNALKTPNKKEVLVIGDNLTSDIEGANKFGYDSLFYNYENKESNKINATYQIDSWKNF